MSLTSVLVPLEVLLSLLAPWPLVRQLGFAPFRERSPRKAASRAALLGVYFLGIAFAALHFTPALHAAAFFAGAFLVGERWRARPAYGRSRGLPPGSLALVPSGIMRDEYFIEKQIARYGPVFKVNRDFHPFVCIYGHERGLKFLREHDESLRGIALPFDRYFQNGFLRYMDPTLHSESRKLFVSGISPQLIDRGTPFFGASIRQALKRLAEDCTRSPTGRVDPDDYLRELVFAAFVPLFFGIPPGSRLFAEVQALYEIIDARKNGFGADRRKREATGKLIERVARQADSYAEDPGDPEDGPPCILRRMMATDPAATRNDGVFGNLIYMVELGGLNDAAGLLRWLLKLLVDHPAWIPRLREAGGGSRAGADGGREAAAERFVMETLRLHQIEFLLRRSTRELEFEGYRIPQRWLIRICIREGNRDPAVFADPEAFDPDRFLNRSYSNTEYSPFGLFRHNCLGAQLTLGICRSFLLELVDGFDLEASGAWRAEHGRSHWEPQRGYPIGLRHRSETAAARRR